MVCPVGVGDSVYLDVKQGQQEVDQIANAAIAQANAIADAITNLVQSVQPILDNIRLGDAGSLSNPFAISTRPVKPNGLELDQPEIGYDPQINEVRFNRTVSAPGDFTKSAPALNLPSQPGALAATPPQGVPVVPERPLPASPSDEIPQIPTLNQIIIPPIPLLTFPSFNEPAPSNLANQEVGYFSWTETNYTQAVLPNVLVQIQAILGGATGIPNQVWDMIWARARRQILRQARKGREDAIGMWAGRGFFMPTGFLDQKLQEAMDLETDQIGDVTREQVTQDAKIYVERLNGAITSGIALEGTLIGLYNEQARRKLEAARTVIEMAIQAARVRIEVYNAQMTGWHIKAQVTQLELQIELGKLESVKIELEAQKLIGELNMQEVEIYKAELQGVLAKYELFKTQIQAVIAQYEGDKVRVQAFGELVAVYKAQVEAKTAEWNGYAEAVKGEETKMEGFKTETNAYLARVQAYQSGVQADAEEMRAKVSGEQLKIDYLRVLIQKFDGLLRSEQARVDTLARVFEADVRAWGVEGDIERSRVQSDTTRFETLLRNAQIRAQIEMDNLKLKIESANQANSFQLAGLEAVLRAATQVGASALSALNYAAHVTSSFQQSAGCSETYSHEE
jgi:hypothetical protein